jgi:hypothetical protein
MAMQANAIVSFRFMVIKFYGLKNAERQTLNAERLVPIVEQFAYIRKVRIAEEALSVLR